MNVVYIVHRAIHNNEHAPVYKVYRGNTPVYSNSTIYTPVYVVSEYCVCCIARIVNKTTLGITCFIIEMVGDLSDDMLIGYVYSNFLLIMYTIAGKLCIIE